MKIKHTLAILALSLGMSQLVHAVCTNPNITDNAPDTRYNISADGSAVTDMFTGLTWQRCSLGQTWDNENGFCNGVVTPMDWSAALGAASAQSAEHWRLPNVKELASLVRYCVASPGPTINTTVFPDTPGTAFWSSTPFAAESEFAWTVNFYAGDVLAVGFGRGSAAYAAGGEAASEPEILRFGLPDLEDPQLSLPESQTLINGSIVINMVVTPPPGDGLETTVVLSGIVPGWGVDTSTSGGVYDPIAGTWTLELPPGTPSYSGGPRFTAPGYTDDIYMPLSILVTTFRNSDRQQSAVSGEFEIFVDGIGNRSRSNAVRLVRVGQ